MADKKLTLIVDLINRTEKQFSKIASDLEKLEKEAAAIESSLQQVDTSSFLDDMSPALADARERLTAFGDSAISAGDKMKDFGGTMQRQALPPLLAFIGAMGLVVKQSFSQVRSVENARASMIGYGASVEEADALMREAVAFVRSDKGKLFQREDILEAQANLYGMGVQVENLTKGASVLAKATLPAGRSMQELGSIVRSVQGDGKLTLERFNQLANAGIFLDESLKGTALSAEQLLVEMNKVLPDSLIEGRAQTIDGMLITLRTSFRDLGASILGVDVETSKFVEGGAGDKLVKLLDELPAHLKELRPAFEQIGQAVVRFAEVAGPPIAAVIKFLGKNADTVLIVLTAWLALGTTLKVVGSVVVMFGNLLKGVSAIIKGTQTAILLTTKALKLMRTATLLVATSFKTLRGAMISTGIGALVVLIGVIVAKFMELSDTVGGVGNAIRLFWAEFKVNTLTAIEAFIKGLAKVLNALPGVDNALGDTIETIGWLKNAAEEDSQAIANEIAKTGMAAQETAIDVDDASISITDDFTNILGAAESSTEASEDFFKSLVDSVSEIRDEIRDVYEEINEATTDFQKNVGKENQTYEDKVVGIVADATEEKKSLEKQLKAAKKAGEEEEVEQLKSKIREQSDILETYKDLELDLDKEVRERRRYLNLNELEQLEEDHNKKLDMMKKEFLEEQVQRLQRLIAVQQEHVHVMSMQTVETQAKINAELEKTRTVREQLALQKQGISNWTGEAVTMYAKFVTDSNRIFSGLKLPSGSLNVSGMSIAGRRANGGPVAGGKTYLVGEKGPELFTPEQSGRISANGSGGGPTISIVFSNNHFTNEDFAAEIERTLEARLKRQMRFSLP